MKWSKVCISIACIFWATISLASGNLLSNGGFENPEYHAQPEVYYPGSNIGGWLVNGTGTNHVYLFYDPIPAIGGNGIEGFNYVQIKDSGRNGANISQTLDFEPGQTYELSFFVGSADPDNNPSQLDIVSYYPANTLQNSYIIGNIAVPNVPTNPGSGNKNWHQHVLYFTPLSGQERLVFRNDSSGYLLLDGVNLVLVPEPSSLALVALVVMGFSGGRSRRQLVDREHAGL